MTTKQWLKTLSKPLIVRRVEGHSMQPTLDGGIVLASSLLRPKLKKVAIVRHKGKEYIKRVVGLKERVKLKGDNASHSIELDIPYSDVLATVFWPKL